MALVFGTQPSVNSVNFASSNITIGANLDDLGDQSLVLKTMTLQLVTNTGNTPIHAKNTYEPTTVTQVIRKQISKLCGEHLTSVVPTLGTSGATADSGFSVDFKVIGNEITLTKADNSTTTDVVNSNVFKVVNAYVQNNKSITPSANMVLTAKKNVRIARDAYDWVRIVGTTTIDITYIYADGVEIAASQVSASDCLYQLGAATMVANENLNSVRVGYEITGYRVTFGTGKVITYQIFDKCVPANERIDIYFLEPLGSWSVMHFKYNVRESIDIEQDVIDRGEGFDDSLSAKFTDYGRRAIRHRSSQSFKLEKLPMIYDGNEEFYMAFANAREYRAVFRYSDTTAKNLLAPIILDETNFDINDRELSDFSISGYYGIDLK